MSAACGPTLGSLFSGYGGLDVAIERVFGARTAWVSDIEEGPSKVLARHFPHAPNLGDITRVNWYDVPLVDILTGGSPCQDISAAGRRAGMVEGTRSNLWVAMREGISILKPQIVIWENVRGALSARADSDMGWTEGLLDERDPEQVPTTEKGRPLRALGRVLGDLSSLGYDAKWITVPASRIGAPHKRERVFVLAWRRDADAPHALRSGSRGRSAESDTGPAGGSHASTDGADHRPDPPRNTAAVTLLPTPVAQPSGNTPEDHLRKKPGRDRVTDLAIMVENDLMATGGRLLPTPRATDPASVSGHASPGFTRPLGQVAREECATDFGIYAAAIARWETVIGRPAPTPTVLGQKGRPRLNAVFVEWMMGLPAGWVTDPALGLSRVQQLRLLGNGVVPQQAEFAVRTMARELYEELNE